MLFPLLSSCSMYCWIYETVRRRMRTQGQATTYNLCEDPLQEDLHYKRRIGEDRLHDLRFLSYSSTDLAKQFM